MAKSMRSKRETRLRAIRRELVEPIYDKKDAVKLAPLSFWSSPLRLKPPLPWSVEMANDNQGLKFLKPIGQKLKNKIKIAKRKYRGKGKIRKKAI
ncbi:hypothetical protein DH2020_000259 [Rehmannia glutinosa]|uniref:Uncharacterized protein n=1 Tax=Rehmannia glutinosa TaxID=99300 RepID=A0ABR0XWE0_REHGL